MGEIPPRAPRVPRMRYISNRCWLGLEVAPSAPYTSGPTPHNGVFASWPYGGRCEAAGLFSSRSVEEETQE